MFEGDDPRIGRVIHLRYKILDRIAAGAMGVIYRAERVGPRLRREDEGLEFALVAQVDQDAHLDLLHLHLDADPGEHRDDGLDDRQAPALVLARAPFELEAIRITGLGKQLFPDNFTFSVLLQVLALLVLFAAFFSAVLLTLTSPDRELIGQWASKIRAVRPPEPYKGKGIKYSTETIRRKEGKKK